VGPDQSLSSGRAKRRPEGRDDNWVRSRWVRSRPCLTSVSRGPGRPGLTAAARRP